MSDRPDAAINCSTQKGLIPVNLGHTTLVMQKKNIAVSVVRLSSAAPASNPLFPDLQLEMRLTPGNHSNKRGLIQRR
jgi:hypothetical protein